MSEGSRRSVLDQAGMGDGIDQFRAGRVVWYPHQREKNCTLANNRLIREGSCGTNGCGCQIGLVTRRKQAIASSVAYKTMHKRTQMWFKGMKCLCSRRISKWTERPEPDPQVNIFPSS